jgi:hypothetical protein
MRKTLIALSFVMFSSFALLGQQAKAILLSNDLIGLDNSLELTLNDDGLIVFILASYYPGPSFMEQYSLDIVKKPYELHDRGVVTDEDIVPMGPTSYSVKSKARIPLTVTIGGQSVRLDLGGEIYIISKQNDYVIESGPGGKSGKIDDTNRTIYSISKGIKNSFKGYTQQRWFPDRQNAVRNIDFVAKDSPEDISFDGVELKAVTFQYTNQREAVYMYDYTIPLAKSRDINLMNYLILLTQRCDENDPSYPVIHPVLLTLYYYDALMAAN